jgi:hypothetical protein
MRYRFILVGSTLMLTVGGCAGPGSLGHGGGSRAWIGPTTTLRYGSYRDLDPWPANPGYGGGLRHGSAIRCDRFGRCWQLRPSDPFEHRYAARARPPGWAEDLPRSARSSDRFLRPRSNVVCDRASRICYKNDKIDKSDTERVFGDRAGDRADDLRDRFGTARLFVPQRGVACDRDRNVCLEDGDPDRKLTRRYLGKGAARALAGQEPQGEGRKGKRRGKRKQG